MLLRSGKARKQLRRLGSRSGLGWPCRNSWSAPPPLLGRPDPLPGFRRPPSMAALGNLHAVNMPRTVAELCTLPGAEWSLAEGAAMAERVARELAPTLLGIARNAGCSRRGARDAEDVVQDYLTEVFVIRPLALTPGYVLFDPARLPEEARAFDCPFDTWLVGNFRRMAPRRCRPALQRSLEDEGDPVGASPGGSVNMPWCPEGSLAHLGPGPRLLVACRELCLQVAGVILWDPDYVASLQRPEQAGVVEQILHGAAVGVLASSTGKTVNAINIQKSRFIRLVEACVWRGMPGAVRCHVACRLAERRCTWGGVSERLAGEVPASVIAVIERVLACGARKIAREMGVAESTITLAYTLGWQRALCALMQA